MTTADDAAVEPQPVEPQPVEPHPDPNAPHSPDLGRRVVRAARLAVAMHLYETSRLAHEAFATLAASARPPRRLAIGGAGPIAAAPIHAASSADANSAPDGARSPSDAAHSANGAADGAHNFADSAHFAADANGFTNGSHTFDDCSHSAANSAASRPNGARANTAPTPAAPAKAAA